jgi:ribose 5-phosphate isomerase A
MEKLMSQESEKKNAALQALAFLEKGLVLGVGTGSTVNYFIDALPTCRDLIDTIISSSQATTTRLKALGFQVTPFPYVSSLDLYIDGADEITPHGAMIKGGGGALTQEKILAYASKKIVCIVDTSKTVDVLGRAPLPIEVIPMARSFVARKIVGMGGQPVYREHFVTENGNIILDCHHMNLTDPLTIERQLNQIPGLVCNGIFAERKADQIIVGK